MRTLSPRTQLIIALIGTLFLSGCATTESQRALIPQKVESYQDTHNGEKAVLVVGRFQNRSDYLQGIFSSNVDKLGNQAKTILKNHLHQTNRFGVVDRENMERLRKESALSGVEQSLTGAKFAVTGDVTEFGRKNTGDKQLFGILGKGKTQAAYAKVSLQVVDVSTSEIVYSTQGAGEYTLSNREVAGFGSTAAYDATLNGKVLNFAITEAVNNLARDIDLGIWLLN
jgi:curli biogenesis system outer membrane secretion channel CsgG